MDCRFDVNGTCRALACYSNEKCEARDEKGMPKYFKVTPYETTKQMKEDLDKRFTYYSSKSNQSNRLSGLCLRGKSFSEYIVENTPESREQSLALTKLEEVVMWANSAIIRNEI